MKNIILKSILFYQKHLSPDTGWLKKLFLTERVCRFTPACSQYTYDAIKKYGTIKGAWLGLKRVMRCNPFNKGGQDYLL